MYRRYQNRVGVWPELGLFSIIALKLGATRAWRKWGD